MTFRGPLVTRIVAPDSRVATAGEQWSSLTTTLRGQDKFFGLAGNVNFDWPVPKGPIPAIDLKTWTHAVPIQLIGLDKFYRGPGQAPNFDWPNPRGPIPSIDLRTWIQNVEIQLSGADKFFGLGGPINFDWPVPRGPAWPSDLRTGFTARPSINLTIIVSPPIIPHRWPNPPLGPTPSIDLRTWINPVPLNLLGLDQFFGPPGMGPDYDWPNPRGPTPNLDLRTWIQSLDPSIQTQSPFQNYDWPNPRGPAPLLVKLHTALGLDIAALPSTPRVIVVTRSWAIDTTAAINSQGWMNGSTFNLYTIPAPPFFLDDWPNPRGPAFANALLTWIDPLKINLRSKDAFFGLAGHPNFDWPNPRGPVPGIDLKTWLQNSTSYYKSTPVPFYLTYWPNPGKPSPLNLSFASTGVGQNLILVPGPRKPLFTGSGISAPYLWKGRS